MRKTIAVDIDGVLADTVGYYLTKLHELTGQVVDRKSLEGKSEKEAIEDPALFFKVLNTPGFFRTIPVMPGALETMLFLNAHFELYICSAAMEFPNSFREKFDWIREHFSYVDWKHIIFCGNKNIVATDYMLDDYPRNLEYFQGTGILFSAFHNCAETRFDRVDNWEDVKRYFRPAAAEMIS